MVTFFYHLCDKEKLHDSIIMGTRLTRNFDVAKTSISTSGKTKKVIRRSTQ